MHIDIGSIPPEGILIEGEEGSDLFQLREEGEEVRAASPLRYRLHASLQGDELLLQGTLEAQFELRCVRCLEFFTKTVRLDPYTLLHPVENTGIQDLTDRVREDILLDLPGYPRCEQADSPRECPKLGSFAPESDYKKIQSSGEEKNVWKELDKLDPKSEEKSGDH